MKENIIMIMFNEYVGGKVKFSSEGKKYSLHYAKE